MNGRITVTGGGGGFVLAATPLYLAETRLVERIDVPDASPFALVENADGAKWPEILLFTIPNHLTEKLWLEDIPRLTGTAPPVQTETGEEWRALDFLATLLQTIDPEFRAPVEAVFEATPGPAGHGEDSIARKGAGSRCAWLNMDEHGHFARARPAGATNGGNDGAPTLEIGPGEGIAWRADAVHVSDCAAGARGPRTRLLLFAS